MSVLERCPSYKQSNKGSKEWQGPTISVRFTEVSVLYRCPLRESRLYYLPRGTKTIKSAAKVAAAVDESENISQGNVQAMLVPRYRNWKAESYVQRSMNEFNTLA